MLNGSHEIVEHLVRQTKIGNRETFSRLVRVLMKDVQALALITQNCKAGVPGSCQLRQVSEKPAVQMALTSCLAEYQR